MSLKGGVSTSELFDTINDAKNGKKKAFDKLAKYAEDGTINPDAYNNLIEKYGSKREERKKRNTKALLLGLLLLVVCLVFICKAFAHSGRTDSNGGHWDRSTGTYHYHTGEYAGRSTSSSSNNSGSYIGGYNKGYNAGLDDGHETGYQEGYEVGRADGYEEGYAAHAKNISDVTLFYILALIVITIIVLLVKFIKKLRKK